MESKMNKEVLELLYGLLTELLLKRKGIGTNSFEEEISIEEIINVKYIIAKQIGNLRGEINEQDKQK
ncbi:MAG: hypothetical protein RSE41_09655 [Clostridia bacterium]